MTETCQPSESFAVAVAGTAGSGKSTLGRALATKLRVPLVDLDAVTTPLLDAVAADLLEEHWLAGPHAPSIRRGRYAALRAVAADALTTAGGVVVVAPFTRELEGGEEWALLQAALAPAVLRVAHLDGDAELFTARRAERGESRDLHRTEVPARTPAIPVLRIDAELSTAQQLARLCTALDLRLPLDQDADVFTRTYDAVLFDLDGTLVDSTASVTRSWRRFAAHYGVSTAALHENHGRPAGVLISQLLPPELHAEGRARILDLELADAVNLPSVRGAREFYGSVPAERRAIVTSGTAALAAARLQAAGLTAPEVFVSADDVARGKPDPEPFRTAAARLGVDPQRCLVLEDAAAGIAAARAAGCTVIALTGTTDVAELPADLVIDGLDRIVVSPGPDGLRLRPAA